MTINYIQVSPESEVQNPQKVLFYPVQALITSLPRNHCIEYETSHAEFNAPNLSSNLSVSQKGHLLGYRKGWPRDGYLSKDTKFAS